MTDFDVVIVAGGLSTRMGFDKLSAFLGEQTVLTRAVRPFLSLPYIRKTIVVSDKRFDLPEKVVYAPAGKTRARSVQAGLQKVTAPYVLIHDGARPFVTAALIEKLCREAEKFGSAVPFLPVTDSIRRIDGDSYQVCDRSEFILLQTPQVFSAESILRAYKNHEGKDETDDSALYDRYIAPPHYVEGEFANKKITRPEDVFAANASIGTGFDLHRLVPGRALRLCGVTVPYPLGEEAHSDGDAPIHALMDALLTALGLPDIGHLFPDTDPVYKDIDSTLLLKDVVSRVREKNREILSVDIAILLQKPKISPYSEAMTASLATVMAISPEKINLSATTTESIGLIGENKAVAALAVVSVL